ncbi:MAG: glycoside hydrolase family 2 TIM barrel-domain containing protein [Kiritimatiellae bacterium]|nr:glycoside hydrolase family 2 TIM barrel-domain containing protein [Kiritimatiellia bacterium]
MKHDTRYTPALSDPGTRLSLAGEWRVSRWPFAADEAVLAAPAQSDAAWETAVQPGKIFYADPDYEAHPDPKWNRVTLDHINPEDGAVLRRLVAVPAEWRGKRIMLRFDAVYPAGRFYLNGILLGEHLSGLTPVEFDVTDLVTPGQEALIAVRLIRRHRFVQMDMPRHALEFAGLAQDAMLFAVEPCHVRDYHLVSSLSEDLAKGGVTGTVHLANAGKSAAKGHLEASLLDATGAVVASASAKVNCAADAASELPVALTLARPALWNDEYPNLYTVRLELKVMGQATQTLVYRTGFRRLELSTSGASLNGHPVKFRGVNHLTFHPEGGLYTPEPWLRRNLTLMKRANVNAIRTHFFGPRALSDLCDELGIYLLQELPVDWGTHYIHDPEWMPPGLLRVEGGVRRDRHHPSIMVWSVGNENMPESKAVAEQGWAHLRRYEAFVKELDPSRATMFPPPGPANAVEGILELRVGDIADIHYSLKHIQAMRETGAVINPNSWEKGDVVKNTREEALARGWSGVWFSSEYGIFNCMPDLLHAPYGSVITDVAEDVLGSKNSLQAFEDRLAREWGLMRDDPTCLGGAYFPWLCGGAGDGPDGNPWGWIRWGEDADWGIMAADLTPKPFFWALRVLFSPVQFPARVYWSPGQTEIVFKVHNFYNSIDLRECKLRTQQNVGGTWMGMMRAFQDIPMSCPPGADGEIRIPIAEASLKALGNGGFGFCRCSLLAPDGFRPITADILILTERERRKQAAGDMPVGPDAVL